MILFLVLKVLISNVEKNIFECKKTSVPLYGALEMDIKHNIFKERKAINMNLVVREPIIKVRNNTFNNSVKLIALGGQNFSMKNQWQLTPEFSDESYNLNDGSPQKEKEICGSDLGFLSN